MERSRVHLVSQLIDAATGARSKTFTVISAVGVSPVTLTLISSLADVAPISPN